MAAYTKLVEEDGSLTGLHAYHAARPPHSEGLAVTIASYLAHETDLPTINLLHLSSAKAMDAAVRMAGAFPHVDFRREVTIGHLLADVDTAGGRVRQGEPAHPSPRGRRGAVGPRAGRRRRLGGVRPRLLQGRSPRCPPSTPTTSGWPSPGFGGTEYLLSGLYSEGTRRGLSPAAVARLVSTNPARRYGLVGKGSLEVGFDADVVLLDPDVTYVVRAEESPSSQGYTPFEGHELTGRVRRRVAAGEPDPGRRQRGRPARRALPGPRAGPGLTDGPAPAPGPAGRRRCAALPSGTLFR